MALPQRTPTPAIEPAPAATTPPPLAPVEAAVAGTASTAAPPWGERRDGSRMGGEVGRMHAELRTRLTGTTAPAALPHERLVRWLSVAGGYAALAAGYGVVALLLLR